MARCGCDSGSCACFIQGSTTASLDLDVTGAGTELSPYTITGTVLSAPVGTHNHDAAYSPVGHTHASSGTPGYFADALPTTPHANDDEFNDSTLGAAWTEYDPSNVVTVSEDTHGLLISGARVGSGSDFLGGVTRTIPSGDWSITTKVAIDVALVGVVQFGMALFENNLQTSDITHFQIGTNTVATDTITRIAVNNFNANNSFVSTSISRLWGPSHAYMRIRRTTATYHMDVSSDGRSWIRMFSNTLSYTPTLIGFAMNNNSNGNVDTFGRALFWRQSADTNIHTPVLGRRVT